VAGNEEEEDVKRRVEHDDMAVSVSVETWGDGVQSYGEELLWELGPLLSKLGAEGPSVSAGGLSGGVGATFSLPLQRPTGFGAIADRAVELFEAACSELGLTHRGIARVDVLDERLLHLELEREPEGYVGVTEFAGLLGVSRQRVAQLRDREDFPAPIAELAAGPVWTRTSLTRFVEAWPRRPGRPRSRGAA